MKFSESAHLQTGFLIGGAQTCTDLSRHAPWHHVAASNEYSYNVDYCEVSGVGDMHKRPISFTWPHLYASTQRLLMPVFCSLTPTRTDTRGMIQQRVTLTPDRFLQVSK